MSAKITITGDDKTGSLFSSLKSKLKDTGAAADKFGSSVANSARGLSQLFNINALKESGTKLFGLISSLAEHGNEGMENLRHSVVSVQSAFNEAASDPQFQDFLNGIADTIETRVVPAIGGLPDAWRSAQDSISRGLLSVAEKLGLAGKGSREELDQMQEDQRKLNDARKKEQEIVNARLRQQRLLKEFNKAAASDARGQYLQNVHDEETLKEIKEDEIERVKKLMAVEKDDEKVKKEIAELQKLSLQVDVRISQVRQEQAARDKEDNQRRIEGIKKVRAIEAALVRDEVEWQNIIRAKHEEVANKRAEVERQRLEKYREQVQKVTDALFGGNQQAAGGQGGGSDLAAGVLGDPRLQRRAGANARRNAAQTARGRVNKQVEDEFSPERKRIEAGFSKVESDSRFDDPETKRVKIETAKQWRDEQLKGLRVQQEQRRRQLEPSAIRKAIRGVTPEQQASQAIRLGEDKIDKMTLGGVKRGTIKGEDVQIAKDALRTNQNQLNENQKQTRLLENIQKLLTPQQSSGRKQPPINRAGAQQRGRGNGFG